MNKIYEVGYVSDWDGVFPVVFHSMEAAEKYFADLVAARDTGYIASGIPGKDGRIAWTTLFRTVDGDVFYQCAACLNDFDVKYVVYAASDTYCSVECAQAPLSDRERALLEGSK